MAQTFSLAPRPPAAWIEMDGVGRGGPTPQFYRYMVELFQWVGSGQGVAPADVESYILTLRSAPVPPQGVDLQQLILGLIPKIPVMPQPIVRFYGDLAGLPTAGQELFAVEMVGDEHFPVGLGRNIGSVGVAPTGSVTFPIKVNGIQLGAMNVAAGQTTATWTLASAYDALAGDLMAFYAPAVADATLASPRYTFVGTRN